MPSLSEAKDMSLRYLLLNLFLFIFILFAAPPYKIVCRRRCQQRYRKKFPAVFCRESFGQTHAFRSGKIKPQGEHSPRYGVNGGSNRDIIFFAGFFREISEINNAPPAYRLVSHKQYKAGDKARRHV